MTLSHDVSTINIVLVLLLLLLYVSVGGRQIALEHLLAQLSLQRDQDIASATVETVRLVSTELNVRFRRRF